jgi:hypothetical protein
MIFSRPRKNYWVRTKWIETSNGGRNFVATPSLSRAKRLNKKLKLKHRQIDVREHGKKPYVLKGSWYD